MPFPQLTLEVLVSIVSACIATWGAYLGRKGVRQARVANEHADKANAFARESNEIARAANERADKANAFARESNEIARAANERADKANAFAQESNAIAREEVELARRGYVAAVEHHDVRWRVVGSGIDYVTLDNQGTSTAHNVHLLVKQPGAEHAAPIRVGEVGPAGNVRVKVADFGKDAAELLKLMADVAEYEQSLLDAARDHRHRRYMREDHVESGSPDGIPEEFADFDLEAHNEMLARAFEQRKGLTPKAVQIMRDKLKYQARYVDVAVRWESQAGSEFKEDFKQYRFEDGFKSKSVLEEAVRDQDSIRKI